MSQEHSTNIPVGISDFQRAIPLLLNPVDLWHTGGAKSLSELGDAVRIRKLTPDRARSAPMKCPLLC